MTTGPTYEAAQLCWAIPRSLSVGKALDAYTLAADLYMVADDPRYVIASIIDWACGAAFVLGGGGPLAIENIYTADGAEVAVEDAPPEVALTSRLIVMASKKQIEDAAECLMRTDNSMLHLVFLEMAQAYADLLAGYYLNPN